MLPNQIKSNQRNMKGWHCMHIFFFFSCLTTLPCPLRSLEEHSNLTLVTVRWQNPIWRWFEDDLKMMTAHTHIKLTPTGETSREMRLNSCWKSNSSWSLDHLCTVQWLLQSKREDKNFFLLFYNVSRAERPCTITCTVHELKIEI